MSGASGSHDPWGLGSPSGGRSQPALLAWGTQRLQGLEGANGAQDARTLLEWAMGVDSLWSAPVRVPATAAERFRQGVAQRRHGTPLQHIVGRMWFRGLELEARPGVFVVRPETEVLAGLAIESASAATGDAPRVVDLCTGSGAIALAIAAEVPGARVTGVDISPEAVQLARENADRLGLDVEFLEGDATAYGATGVDVVVSNPPYVPPREMPTQREAQADPALALEGGGEDGLVVPRGIITTAARVLAPGGTLLMEHSPSQAAALRALARSEGFGDVGTEPDLTGADRFLRGKMGA